MDDCQTAYEKICAYTYEEADSVAVDSLLCTSLVWRSDRGQGASDERDAERTDADHDTYKDVAGRFADVLDPLGEAKLEFVPIRVQNGRRHVSEGGRG